MSDSDHTKLADLERKQAARVKWISEMKDKIDAAAAKYKADLDANVARRQLEIDNLRAKLDSPAEFPALRAVS